jgi:hypothetical protein
MSEEKIIQHSEKAVSLLKNRSKTIKEKILGFLEEIVIIIIAVSLTLAFHNWNDRRNEREIERNFLIGTRQDLLKSAADVREGVKEYQRTVDYYDTVWQQINSHRIDAAYIDKNSGNLINTMYFGYDGLLKDLMLVYSVELPFQKEMDITAFHKRMEDFDQYIGTKAKIDSSGEIHVSALLDEPAVRYQIFHYRFYLQERQNQKTALAQKLLVLADEIGKELNK